VSLRLTLDSNLALISSVRLPILLVIDSVWIMRSESRNLWRFLSKSLTSDVIWSPFLIAITKPRKLSKKLGRTLSSRLVYNSRVVWNKLTDRSEPLRNWILSIASNMSRDNDDGQKRWQRDQYHVHAEIRSYTLHYVTLCKYQKQTVPMQAFYASSLAESPLIKLS
jgi:hypothetical protein